VIDVFYKLRELKKQKVKIILHCFEYGRQQQEELKKYCAEVYYYKRKKNVLQLFSDLPFIVKSRINDELKKNLLKNNYPILFEGLHTCFLLGDKDFSHRTKIFRESNIEHEYYRHLASAEKNKLKKNYYLAEAKKLEKFESVLTNADLMLIVSKTETEYFKKKFPDNKVEFLPSFHGNETITSKKGKGKYILYHGKLSVAENETAAMFLIEKVFSQLKQSVIIAGMDPSSTLAKKCALYKNIQLLKNPSEKKMNELIENAQLHCLYTAQPTGLKLKLLNVLYKGRFVIVNKNMVTGTTLKSSCILAETPAQWIKEINNYFEKTLGADDIRTRKETLKEYDNPEKTKRLIGLIWN
jgi:hypothetical protein